MTNSSTQHGTFLKSAFKIVYFVAFILTTFEICSQADKFKVAGMNDIDNSLFHYLNMVFVWIIGLHTIRLYITIEMLDDKDFIFLNFFDSANRWQKISEFIIRTIIIGIVSYKLVKWNGSENLNNYLLWLYTALFAWGIIVWTFRSFKDTYLLISGAGLFISLGMNWLIKIRLFQSVAVWSVILLIAIVLIGIDVVIDYNKNKNNYKLYFTSILTDIKNLGN